MKTRFVCIALGVLFLSSTEARAQSLKGDPANGQAIYREHCFRCQGQALDGNGPEAASLQIPPTDFHAPHSRIKDEADLKFTLMRGRSFTAKHGWDEQLRIDQIRDVVTYIRSVVPHEGY